MIDWSALRRNGLDLVWPKNARELFLNNWYPSCLEGMLYRLLASGWTALIVESCQTTQVCVLFTMTYCMADKHAIKVNLTAHTHTHTRTHTLLLLRSCTCSRIKHRPIKDCTLLAKYVSHLRFDYQQQKQTRVLTGRTLSPWSLPSTGRRVSKTWPYLALSSTCQSAITSCMSLSHECNNKWTYKIHTIKKSSAAAM